MSPSDALKLQHRTDTAILRVVWRAARIRDCDVLLELDLCPTDEQAEVIRERITAWRKRARALAA